MALGRRRLLLVGGGIVCAHAIGCGGSEPIVLAAEIPAGPKSSVNLSTLRPVSGAAVAIGRDGGGIYAMTLVCTHQGCDIGASGSVTFARLHCDCHGSEFTNQGVAIIGPATRPLDHLLVTEDVASGALTIHGQQIVSPTTRLAV
jgi:Rieske Fe-S protein